MARATSVPITPEVLNWAVKESGHDPDAVASSAGVSSATVEAWMTGREQPTLTQFHKLANFLKRPQALFFLPRPPRTRRPDVEFRYPPGAARREWLPEERLNIREAARLQRGLAWVMEELGGDPSSVPKLATTQGPEDAAATARERLGITVAEQLEWDSPFEAQRRWREVLHRVGIVVLFLPMGKDAVRGFSLWHPRAPLIAVNTYWNAQARSYTMFHEYGHILTRTSSMCALAPPKAWRHAGDEVERWCEQFAAAFLAPWAVVAQLLATRYAWKHGERFRDLGPATFVANKLHISLRASVLRLVSRGVASWSLYEAIPPYVDRKRKGGPSTGGRRRPQIRVDEFGVRATRTFLEGVRREAITRDDALRYLDVADTELPELEALTAAG